MTGTTALLPTAETGQFRLSEIIAALSFALDLTEGQALGHSARACAVGMRLAEAVGLDAIDRSDLFYALLMKDAGCSANASRLSQLFGADDRELKRHHKLIDWTRLAEAAIYALRHTGGTGLFARLGRVARIAGSAEEVGREMIATRCERGADVVRMIGLSPATADGIRNLDEHWDGSGHPLGLAGESIPLFGRFLAIGQTFEVFYRERGAAAAFDVVRRRSGTWFDPALAKSLLGLRGDRDFWDRFEAEEARALAETYEPAERILGADERRVNQIAEAFAIVIDAKSPYTYHHSAGVAAIAVELADRLDLGAASARDLRLAGLLHDIGKLAVPNTILDKSGKLTEAEWAVMRQHPAYTYEILGRIEPFRALAGVAAAHHERLDGTGYHLGLAGDQLTVPARVLAVADICEALQADRPYRGPLPWEEVRSIMGRLAGPALCPTVYEALECKPPAGAGG
ncbi:MAG: HD-GYP domain-containing protein [Gemmatimonadales bacterium]